MRSLISAEIPLYKLKNESFREFLHKYTQNKIPDEWTLRKTYAPPIYNETVQTIREEIKEGPIVSIDYTIEKECRHVDNVVIDFLSEKYSKWILFHYHALENFKAKL